MLHLTSYLSHLTMTYDVTEDSIQRDFDRCDDAIERGDAQRLLQCAINSSLRGMRVLHMATIVADTALDPNYAFRVYESLRKFREGLCIVYTFK